MRAIEGVAEMVGIVDVELLVEQVGRIRAWHAANDAAAATDELEE